MIAFATCIGRIGLETTGTDYRNHTVSAVADI